MRSLFSRHPGQYITTILVGNNIALVIYSLQMSLLIQTLLSLTGWGLLSGGSFLLETVLSTIIIIFAAEYIPKAVVRLNPNLYYRTGFPVLPAVLSAGAYHHFHFDADPAYFRVAGQYAAGGANLRPDRSGTPDRRGIRGRRTVR